MKVKFLGKDNPPELLHGKIYNVIGMNTDTGWYRIVCGTNEDHLFPPKDFEVLGDVIPQEILIRLMWESELERIEYIDKAGAIHTGFVEIYSSRYDNEGEASLCFVDDVGEMSLVFEHDILEIKILESTVMKEAFAQLDKKMIEFICKEFHLSEADYFALAEADLDILYDQLCDIELEETPSDSSSLTERGKIVESIVTVVGNYFSQKLRYDDSEFD